MKLYLDGEMLTFDIDGGWENRLEERISILKNEFEAVDGLT